MTSEGVPYDAVDSHAELIGWSRACCRRAVRRTDLAVDLDRVDWRVSTRAKRRAAAVERPRIPDATVGTPLDWAAADAAEGSEPPSCTVALTWAAFEAFSRAEWRETLRHELIHVEQFQRFGTTGHGAAFRRRADDLDASVHCRRFSTPSYRLYCTACGDVVARRYQKSKLVRNHGRYRSACCDAPLDREDV
ncbi:MAG: SprT-like domain-containing protein [Haloarculaceae archaeon]